MNWSEYRKKLLSDPEVKVEYDKLAGEYDLARSIIVQQIGTHATDKREQKQYYAEQ
jgi:hypothetical protein